MAQGEDAAAQAFVFLVSSPSHITSLPIWVALGSGYFAEQSLDVRIVSGIGGPLGIAMLLSGEGQVGAFGDTAVRAAFQGVPVKVVATPVSGANFYLYSRADLANVNQLKGKTIGVSTLNSTPHVVAMKILREHYGWVDPVRDVRWHRVAGQRLQSLQRALSRRRSSTRRKIFMPIGWASGSTLRLQTLWLLSQAAASPLPPSSCGKIGVAERNS